MTEDPYPIPFDHLVPPPCLINPCYTFCLCELLTLPCGWLLLNGQVPTLGCFTALHTRAKRPVPGVLTSLAFSRLVYLYFPVFEPSPRFVLIFNRFQVVISKFESPRIIIYDTKDLTRKCLSIMNTPWWGSVLGALGVVCGFRWSQT